MAKWLWCGVALVLAAVAAGAAEWDPRPGELGLEGKVVSANPAGRSFLLEANRVLLARGKSQPLDPPRRKTVLVAAATAFTGVKGLSGLKPGGQVRVAGKDSGPGKPLRATRVELLGGGAAVAGGLGPWEALVGGEPGDPQPLQVLDLKTGSTRPLPGEAVSGESPRIGPDRVSYYFWRDLKEAPKLLVGRLGSAPRVLRPWPSATETAGSCWSADGKCIYAAQAQKEFDMNGFSLISVPLQGYPQTVRLVNSPFEGVSSIVHELVALQTAPDILATNHNWHEMIALRPPNGTARRVTTFSDWEEAQLGVPKGVAQPEPLNPKQERATGKVYFSLSYLVSQIQSEQSGQAKAARRRLGIFTMAPDGSGIARVPIESRQVEDGSVRQPYLVDLSPDGRTLLMTYWKTPGLYTVPATGGTPAAVPGKGAALSAASWSG